MADNCIHRGGGGGDGTAWASRDDTSWASRDDTTWASRGWVFDWYDYSTRNDSWGGRWHDSWSSGQWGRNIDMYSPWAKGGGQNSTAVFDGQWVWAAAVDNGWIGGGMNSTAQSSGRWLCEPGGKGYVG